MNRPTPIVPTFYGREWRRVLTEMYGIPNSWPRTGEGLLSTKRLLFVNDDDGKPAAFWYPSIQDAVRVSKPKEVSVD